MKVHIVFDDVAGDSLWVHREDLTYTNKKKFWQDVLSSLPRATYTQIEERGKSIYPIDTDRKLDDTFKITKDGLKGKKYIIIEPKINFSSMLKELNRCGMVCLDIKEL